jgi:hypothetical protein
VVRRIQLGDEKGGRKDGENGDGNSRVCPHLLSMLTENQDDVACEKDLWRCTVHPMQKTQMRG